MKKVFLVSIFILFSTYLFSQGDLAAIEPIGRKFTTEYDGSENYLKKRVYLYIGQTLRYRCDSKKEQKESSFVLGFTTDYKIIKDKYGLIYPDTYHPTPDNMGTDYHKIANNLFKVVDVFPHPDAGRNKDNMYNIYYLKMQNLSLGDIVYYEYIAVDKERYFPFIVTKHLQYLRNKYKGEIYQVIGEQFETIEVTCFDTKKVVEIKGKSWWKCIDLIIDKENCQISLVLENHGHKIIIPEFLASYILKI